MNHFNVLFIKLANLKKRNKSIRKCCDGWVGVACDQALLTTAATTTQLAKKVTNSAQKIVADASCSVWGKDHFTTFNNNAYRFTGK